jgi:thiosulfate/3-mercaptopyruvate sulfurtransferase
LIQFNQEQAVPVPDADYGMQQAGAGVAVLFHEGVGIRGPQAEVLRADHLGCPDRAEPPQVLAAIHGFLDSPVIFAWNFDTPCSHFGTRHACSPLGWMVHCMMRQRRWVLQSRAWKTPDTSATMGKSQPRYGGMSVLMSVQALSERLSSDDTVVFDCRFDLHHPQMGREAYLSAHIPGAYYLDLEQDLSGPAVPGRGRHPLPDPEALAVKLGAAGVDEQATVVVYDEGEGTAPRAWWLIRYLGHSRVYVLDGGWPAWLAAGHDTSAEIPGPRFKSFPLSVRQDWIVSADDVMQVVRGERQALLVDARAPERYRGEIEPLDPKAGHIPGAVNAPWQEGLDADGRWKSAAQQLERFRRIGLAPEQTDTEVICYCGSGVTACANLLALEIAGIRGARLYPGSWSEWCASPDRPVATGPR